MLLILSVWTTTLLVVEGDPFNDACPSKLPRFKAGFLNRNSFSIVLKIRIRNIRYGSSTLDPDLQHWIWMRNIGSGSATLDLDLQHWIHICNIGSGFATLDPDPPHWIWIRNIGSGSATFDPEWHTRNNSESRIRIQRQKINWNLRNKTFCFRLQSLNTNINS